MEPRCCPACGTDSPQAAKFCGACGANLDATLIEFDRAGLEPEELRVARSGTARIAVPLLAIGFVAIAGLAIFAGGGGENAETAVPAERTPVAGDAQRTPPPPTEAPVATASPSGRPPPSPADSPNSAVDPTLLPSTDHTHLAVAFGTAVHFLDLRTGEWTIVDTERRLGLWSGSTFGSGGMQQFGDGVLVQTESGPLLQVSVDGSAAKELLDNAVDGWLMAVEGNLAFVQDQGSSPGTVTAINPDGETEFEIVLPHMTWANGVTTDGRVIAQAGSGIYAIGRDSRSMISRGTISGFVGTSILVYDCDDDLTCATDLVNLQTGERTRTPLPPGYVETTPDGMLRVWDTGGSPQDFHVIDGEVVERAEPGPLQPGGSGLATARASNGATVTVTVSELRFHPADGGTSVTIPFERGRSRCCDDQFGLTFLTVTE